MEADWETLCGWPEVAVPALPEHVGTLEFLHNSSGARCFKSHWRHQDHMAKIPASSKVIYVIRRVEKLIESYWHHHHILFSFYWLQEGDVTWDQYFNAFLRGEVDNGDYFEHIASWWKIRSQPNVMILSFEDLKDDHLGGIRNISQFLGVELDEERIKEVAALTSVDHMKQIEAGDMLLKVFTWLGIVKGGLVREGKKGGQTRITAAQRARLQERFDTVLKPLGVPQDLVLSPE